MSLRIWLPLNGDLHNLGISGNLIQTVAPTWANGKIGLYAMSAGALKMDAATTASILNNLEFSFCCWVYVNADAGDTSKRAMFFGNNPMGANNNRKFSVFLYPTCNDVHLSWQNDAENTTFTGAVWSGELPSYQWTHLAITYKNPNGFMYINGVLKHQFTGVSNSSSFAYETNLMSNGGTFKYLNDYRIYDHCLSATEVKEIALGLILHYKLDNNGRGGRNLVRIGTGAFHNTDQLTTLTWSGWDSYNSLPLTDMDWNNRYGQQITYSCYVENIEQTAGTGSGIMLHVRYADGTYLQFGGGKNGTLGQYLALGESGWLKLTVTIPDASTRSSPTTINRIEVSVRHNSSGGASTIKYKCPLAELGNKLTAWYWAPEDTQEDITIVEDSSGYNHNGQMISNINTSTDTMRYNISALFDGVDDCIIVPYNTICPENIFTMNLWFKKDALGSKNYETLFGGPSGFEMDTRSGSSTALSLYMASTRGGNAATGLQLNTWYMVTMVRDGTNERYYINGELKKEIEAKAMPTGVYRIGAWASNTGQNYYGNISDFRIYCTPLLDTDIKLLYNIGMKVDKSQNIHTYEFFQEDKNKLYKTGILSNADFNEINNVFNLKYDKQLYIEPDGSCWVRIFHHANCDTKLFTSSDSFTTYVYKDADRWFNVSLCNKVTKWELMVKSMPTINGTETKYRWIQTKNPMTAAYADVAAASVTKITGNGYASYSWGGLYHIGSSTYLSTNNGTNGNWWGAVGAWAHHAGGIPGWTTVITTGYEDVYLRVDNLNLENLNAKNNSSNIWTANQFIER